MSDDDQYRAKVKGYWKMYSPIVESMMLSDVAKDIMHDEENEILSYLPDFKDKRVLEIAAGIGRFTGKVADVASHVTTVDFMEDYVQENWKKNGHYKNVTFQCADITTTDFPAGSFDFVFSNWIFMYLNDPETTSLCNKVLKWLVPGGYFFLRESCFGSCGNLNKNDNPSIYRTPLQYCQALQTSKTLDGATFKITRGKNLLKYIQYYGNPTQVCFLAKRIDGSNSINFQRHLNNIFMNERMYGNTWHCTGGETTNRDLCSELCLRPEQRVLDVGCGTGANSFFMARHYGVHVHGIDPSIYKIHVAIDRERILEANVKKKVQFKIDDILAVDYGDNIYDVIYSREAISNMTDKQKLFKKLHKWLKPGGTLFFTDYCRGTGPDTQDFVDYIKNNRNCSLASEEQYDNDLKVAGFTSIRTEDKRDELLRNLEKELKSFVSGREDFVKDFSQDSYDGHTSHWNDKIRWTKGWLLTWVLFVAKK